MTALHNKRLMVNFETDEAEQEREIEAKTREITEVFHHAEGLLKRFSKQSEDPSLSQSERTVRKNMQMSMAKKLQGLSMSFRSTQKVSIKVILHTLLFDDCNEYVILFRFIKL